MVADNPICTLGPFNTNEHFMYTLKFKIVLPLLLVGLIGCTQKKPEGWPDSYPCKITVLQNGAGIDGVNVSLSNVEGQGSWMVSGLTDSQGAAKMETAWTQGSQPGAPEGKFKVMLFKKLPPMVDPTPQAKLDAMSYEERVAHNAKLSAEADKRPPILHEKFKETTTTPIEVTVSKGSNEHVINLDDYK